MLTITDNKPKKIWKKENTLVTWLPACLNTNISVKHLFFVIPQPTLESVAEWKTSNVFNLFTRILSLLSIPLELAYVEDPTSDTSFLFNEVLKDENMYVLTCIVLFAISFVLLAFFHYKMTNLKVLNTNLQKKTADLQTQVSFLKKSTQNLKKALLAQEKRMSVQKIEIENFFKKTATVGKEQENQLKDLATVFHKLGQNFGKNLEKHHQEVKNEMVDFKQQISNLTRPSAPKVEIQSSLPNDRKFFLKLTFFQIFLFLFVSAGLVFAGYFSLRKDIIFRAPGWLYVPESFRWEHFFFSLLIFFVLVFCFKHLLTEHIKNSNLWAGKKKTVALFLLSLMNLLFLPLISPFLAISYACIKGKEILFQSDFLGTFQRLLNIEERLELHQEALKTFFEKINVEEDIQEALQDWVEANLQSFLEKYTEGSVMAKDYLWTELEKQTAFLLSQVPPEIINPTLWNQNFLRYPLILWIFVGIRVALPIAVRVIRSGVYNELLVEASVSALSVTTFLLNNWRNFLTMYEAVYREEIEKSAWEAGGKRHLARSWRFVRRQDFVFLDTSQNGKFNWILKSNLKETEKFWLFQ